MKQNAESIPEFRRALRLLEAEIGLTLSEETECCGVTVAQCHLLLEAEARPSASLNDLAGSLELDKSTLSRSVESLVRRGLVTRDEDPENRRRVSITLTEEGARKTGEINCLCDDHYARVLALIPKEKRGQITESVALLAAAMKRERKEGVNACNSTK